MALVTMASTKEQAHHSWQHGMRQCGRVPFIGHSKEARYLRMATVRASGELAQGQMTSGLRPLDWKTLRKASQEEMDPV